MAENHDPVIADGESPEAAEVTAGASAEGCPVAHGRVQPTQGDANSQWWPNRLNLKILNKNAPQIDPMGADFNYAEEFNSLDLATVKADIAAVLTDSKDWWPADFGNYGPLMIRMAWHSAGTYRISDGRGGAGSGQQRFAPLNSWPDNVSLDKARRLLWPVKRKYGKKISWADLLILTGNVALETMGFKTFGYGGGRVDTWEPEADVYWGPETEWLEDNRYSGDRELQEPLGAVQMGLIYVNPEGPNGNPDPLASARDIRETFRRMAMNDEETVALIAGGHTFGKTHGAGPAENVGPDPEAAPLEEQGLGWKSTYGTGVGKDAITSGIEVTWTYHPTRWDNEFLHILFAYEWELFQSPAGANQWRPKGGAGGDMVPEAFGDGQARAADADVGPGAARRPDLRADRPPFRRRPGGVRRRVRPRVVQAGPPRHGTARALPRPRGPVRGADLAGPGAGRRPRACRRRRHRRAQAGDPRLRPVGATARVDRVGVGLDLPRQRQARRRQRRAGPPRAAERLGGQQPRPARLRADHAERHQGLVQRVSRRASEGRGKKISLADLIVLGRQRGRREGGRGRRDLRDGPVHRLAAPTRATSRPTTESFANLEPRTDGFRNYLGKGVRLPAEYLLIDKANLLTLSAPQMTVLVGGLRVLGANYDGSKLGVFTDTPGALTNDFFANLLDYDTTWTPTSQDASTFEGRVNGEVKWTGSRVDLVFGSNSELRAVAEVYAADDGREKFVSDFVAAWTKVMNADRFDV